MKNTAEALMEKMRRGSGQAALELAESLKWGIFGQVDFKEAERIYRRLAGSRSASLSSKGYYNLGLLYYHGYLGDPEKPDVHRAYRYFVKSAILAPNRAALTKLADMYRYGQAVPKNDQVALTLYTRASQEAC